VAVLEGKLGVVEELLAAGAEPDALNSAGAAPLHLAAQKGQVEVVGALLGQGADPNVKNAKGWGPVLVSVFWCFVWFGVWGRT
jgi:ankyrin repeat protein